MKVWMQGCWVCVRVRQNESGGHDRDRAAVARGGRRGCGAGGGHLTVEFTLISDKSVCKWRSSAFPHAHIN